MFSGTVSNSPSLLSSFTSFDRFIVPDTISFTMTPISPKDENYQNCMLFVGTDGLTYPWVCDSEGKVLINE